jgi:hypothetical protein
VISLHLLLKIVPFLREKGTDDCKALRVRVNPPSHPGVSQHTVIGNSFDLLLALRLALGRGLPQTLNEPSPCRPRGLCA